MTEKNKMENILMDSMGADSHLGNPPYRGDLLEYIKRRQEEEEKERNKRKVSAVLDEAIFHLENLIGIKDE